MRKLVAVTVAVAAGALVAAAPAGAQQGNNNGCGELFRNLAAPGFGQAVSEAAKRSGFDDEVRFFCNKKP